MHTADQPAPTPRTDAEVVVTAGGDRVPVYFARQLERKLIAKTAETERLREAMLSISKNTCCEGCQEAKRVALSALAATRKEEGNG